jgi:hypothetical protein
MSDDLTLPEHVCLAMGLTTPFKRATAGFGAVTGLILFTKPLFAFDEKGNAKPWALISKDPFATSVPWWLPGIVVGGLISIYI